MSAEGAYAGHQRRVKVRNSAVLTACSSDPELGSVDVAGSSLELGILGVHILMLSEARHPAQSRDKRKVIW